MCRSKQTPLRRGFLFQGNANELRTVRPDPFHPGVLPRVLWAGVDMDARAIRFCLFLLLMSGTQLALADCWSAWEGNTPVYKSSSSGGDACRKFLTAQGANIGKGAGALGQTGGQCYYYPPEGTTIVKGQWLKSPGVSCDYEGPPPDTCEPPKIMLGGQCVEPDPCESTIGSL